MENFLEDLSCSCTSVLLWKRYYVLKLWNIVRGESALCSPKIQEHLSECTWFSGVLKAWRAKNCTLHFMQRTEVWPCQRQLSWYLPARSWYICPTSSNFTLMWKTKICTDSVRLASHSEVTHEDVVWLCLIYHIPLCSPGFCAVPVYYCKCYAPIWNPPLFIFKTWLYC